MTRSPAYFSPSAHNLVRAKGFNQSELSEMTTLAVAATTAKKLGKAPALQIDSDRFGVISTQRRVLARAGSPLEIFALPPGGRLLSDSAKIAQAMRIAAPVCAFIHREVLQKLKAPYFAARYIVLSDPYAKNKLQPGEPCRPAWKDWRLFVSDGIAPPCEVFNLRLTHPVKVNLQRK